VVALKDPFAKLPLVAISVVMMGLTAQLKFNVGPVPYTMQNLGVTFASLILSPLYAMLSILIYILLIAAGLPIASGGSGGVGVLLGYTAGYLYGFAISAPLMSFLSRIYLKKRGITLAELRKRDVISLLLISLISFLPTYALGFAVFLKYAIPGSKLYSWSTGVSGILGISPSSRYLAIFAASVLIFIPQDLFMDQLLGILLAKSAYRFFREKGLKIE